MLTGNRAVAETLDLGEQIDAQIRSSGPMSISTYMRLCLTHPILGYYKNTDPLGVKGDFITAPEISQLFGEMLGIWIANTWDALGAPKAFDLVELGPGRGTLMADALRAIKTVPDIKDAMRLVLVETNATLIKKQQNLLGTFNPKWATELSDLDDRDTPILIIANEFFDALPIKQFEKKDGAWRERMVGIANGQRQIGLSPTPMPPEAVPQNMQHIEDGVISEQSPTSLGVITGIAERLTKRSGALLAIDYGYTKTQPGDTFQAIENHQFADPFANPGKADLTAHVDFEALATAATEAGANALPILAQSDFLKAMGIEERNETLKVANPTRTKELDTDLNRLIGNTEMGNLFKCLCVSSGNFTPYPFGTGT